LPELKAMYAAIAREALTRAVELHSPGVVLEFEELIEMTADPHIGRELTLVLNEECQKAFDTHGLKCEVRLTPNDLRDFERPPRMRSGEHLDHMLEMFRAGAEAGGDLLSIESTGGKELCDDALLMGNTKQMVFALAVLGVRDMKFLWPRIVAIADEFGKIPGGDTACGFANTAMTLAEKQYIPRVFAAVVRVVSAVRSLVAVEEGARGPDKDCGYEGVYLKAITGIPISMEGKSAACAHFSPVGNVAEACCDLWSNESVQNIKLLAGMAPTVSLEMLEYDVRLLNTAARRGDEMADILQHLLVESDVHNDPQAFVLAPANVVDIAESMVDADSYLAAARDGALRALELMSEASKEGYLRCPERETVWFDLIRAELETIPDEEDAFIAEMIPQIDTAKVRLEDYGIG
jgi:methanol--5-hydroxybenzimidazolylcobamide Co-methyltransferase